MPFDYKDWNPKWYNPLCRGWYKDSVKAEDSGIVSDPYLMAQIDNTLGITPCMPILEERERYGSRFFGALCQDILLIDQTKYFNIDIETKQFIFKKDVKFDEAA